MMNVSNPTAQTALGCTSYALDRALVWFIMSRATRDNYRDVLIATSKKFVHVSHTTIVETVNMIYMLNKWHSRRKFANVPLRQLAREGALWYLSKELDAHFERVTVHHESDG